MRPFGNEMKGPITICLALGAATAIAASAAPAEVDVRYAVYWGEAQVFTEHDRFVRDGDRYRIASEASPKGLVSLFVGDIRRESRGRVASDGLVPERYDEDRGKRGRRTAEFDWQAGRITLHDGEATRSEPLAPGTLDHASFRFAFMFTPPDERGVRIALTDGRRVKAYRYRFLGRETLDTPLGPLDTRHFERVVDAGDHRSFEVWLAVDHHHLPVRIRYADRNSVFDSRLTALSIE